MHDLLKMCNFEGTKSTKGASKMRRDLLNAEIGQLRDLLPLPQSTRQRLSQLQLMALVCVYVRKSNYFQQVLKQQATRLATESTNMEFLKALNGFLIMMTQGGKLLYISDNAAEYLGHSMEDLLIHGDSVFDILDKQDHAAVQAELVRAAQGGPEDDRLFLCRMNVSRNARRQMRFGDQKVVLVHGHFLSYLPLCSRNEPVFLAHCSPVAMPETRESVVQGATNVFTTLHTLDMKIISIDKNGEFYMGYNKESLAGVSWYHLIHPDNLRDAQTKHRLITSSDQERSCILLLRLQAAGGSWRWVHCVLQLKDAQETGAAVPTSSASSTTTGTAQSTSATQSTSVPSPSSGTATTSTTAQPSTSQTAVQQPIIVATNQVLSEREAAVLRSNSWLYHYYTMQSKLQYGLAYEAQRVQAAYYPQVMNYQQTAAETNTSYMAANPLTSHYQQQFTPATHSTHYPLGTSYLHPYHAHYSLRLHSEYARDTTQSYYDYTNAAAHNYVYNYSNTPQSTTPVTENMSPAPSLTPKSRRSTPTLSPKRSPVSQGMSSSESTGGIALATPVAVRPSPPMQTKGSPPLSVDDSELSWKSSPSQEVPDCPEYTPYVTPPYSTTASPIKPTNFSFENSPEAPDHQYVPSSHMDPRETPWYSQAFVR